MATTTGKYTFVIECDSLEIFDKLCGYMSDGGGEYGIITMFEDYNDLSVDHTDIRDDRGYYIGLRLSNLRPLDSEEDDESTNTP